MDEETAIINSNTRNEKIRNFFVNNKRSLLLILLLIVGILIGYFAYSEYRENQKLKISNQYNSIVTEYLNNNNKEKTQNSLVDLIYKNDPTYAPLSLYFIIDNKLITEKSKINILFDNIIQEISLDKEIKNLIIYKKALYNADSSQENELLDILKPIINTKSIWKSEALYLIAEYFYSKGEKQKSKEFFNQILTLENANQDLKLEAQKRLNRDLSE
jgi:predicted negative regulator of RcsB-dependent stress response